jgi:5,10-methylene-tetrahydrofolate dehydrogenase/methenyl tetrahydrofolate cyclohydrolase
MSSAIEVAIRIILTATTRLLTIGKTPLVAVVGSKGFYGSEISSNLDLFGVSVSPIDLGDSLNELCHANIVVAAVGKPQLIVPPALKS